MDIKFQLRLDERAQVVVYGMFEEELDISGISKLLAADLKEARQSKKFSGKFGEIYSTRASDVSFKVVLFVGLGKKSEMTVERIRRVLGKAVKFTKSNRYISLTTNILECVRILNVCDEETVGCAAAEGLILGNYSFNKYLAKERQEKMLALEMVSLQWMGSLDAINHGLQKGRIIAEATNMVKELVNEPANVVNSLYLEKVAKDVAAADAKIKVHVLEESELGKLKMGALLGVNAGSDNPARLVILEYHGTDHAGFDAAFVGKGITFDSGGYNLKPTKMIEEMNTDMAGAAAVLGAIKAAAKLSLKKNLLGVVPLCENMISGKAQHPGDIVRAYNGKTIQIGNTDAEGRLILADALAYTEEKYHPDVMIDLATLTGACVVALGYYVMGAVSKDDDLLIQLKNAGEKSGDRVWPLPFFDEYQDWMDGTVSDLNNIAMKGKGYEAGAITAGVFLSKFVEKSRWAHLDIAGSAYWAVDNDYVQKGATGSGVRLLLYWLMGK